MIATLQLHTNIKTEQRKQRLYNNEVDQHLGISKGAFNTKLTRLKSGSKTSITAADMAKLMKLFGCTANALFKGVDFGKGK